MAAPLMTAPPLKGQRTAGHAVQNQVFPISEGVVSASLRLPVVAPRGKNWLGEALLEMSPTRPQRRTKDVVASVLFHVLFITAVVLPSLYFTDTIDLKKFTQTFLVAPPPPPPAPPPAPAITRITTTPRRSLINSGKLLAPTVIPKTIVMLKEEPLPLDAGVMGGVPGGVPGGQLGGVIGGIVSETRSYVPPPPQPRAPIRVGGRIKAPRPLQQPSPVYPALARQARITGVVAIDAVIDPQGNVVEARAVSGPPLLIPAALEAVHQWKYEPTYLNDLPVAVELIVTVTFRLDQ